MLDRVFGTCMTALFAAVALYVAVQLIESIAATLLWIVAAIGGLMIVGFVVRTVWLLSGRRSRFNRW